MVVLRVVVLPTPTKKGYQKKTGTETRWNFSFGTSQSFHKMVQSQKVSPKRVCVENLTSSCQLPVPSNEIGGPTVQKGCSCCGSTEGYSNKQPYKRAKKEKNRGLGPPVDSSFAWLEQGYPLCSVYSLGTLPTKQEMGEKGHQFLGTWQLAWIFNVDPGF